MKRFTLRGISVTGLLALAFFSGVVPAQSTKPVIAVGELTSAVGGYDPIPLQLALENALAKTKKFTLMERTRLQALLKERGLSIAGIANGKKSIGGFSGVDYLVYGTVTNASLADNNLLLIRECELQLGLNVRVVDVATGEIRLSDSATIKKGVNTTSTDTNPCENLTISSINFAGEAGIDEIGNKLTIAIFPIKVARISDGGEIYLNYGEGAISKDSTLRLVRLGEGFVDPDTGERLGAEEKTIGVIAVAEVKAGFSIARLLTSSDSIRIGDVARLGDRNLKRAAENCSKSRETQQRACSDVESSACKRAVSRSEDACGGLFTR